jgi:YHS domain-containing protein
MRAYLVRFLTLLVLLGSQVAIADPAVYLNDAGVALSGNDPVAYFSVKAPVKGQPALSTKYQDATYWFSSEENRTAFIADPNKYAPQYGGYCAYAAALGKKAPGDPTQWSVVDNKLYINFDARVQKQWLADVPGYIKSADSKWGSLKNN